MFLVCGCLCSSSFLKSLNFIKIMKPRIDIRDLFSIAKSEKTYLKVCAPMVRYSKVQFRTLVKSFAVDLCFTPMIMADSFCQNAKARLSEFSTTRNDFPLIAQFAANHVNDFIDATKLVYSYVDGVDLNCGCPQGWAMKDGYGSALLSKPELICDLVKGIRNNLDSNFSVSVKIRILKDLKKTINLCKQLEKCGVSFVTIHARTPGQKSSGDINVPALKDVCDRVHMPIIGNGGVRTLSDADELFELSNCNGVMAASGILANPALFSGANRTPLSCVKVWQHLKDLANDKITFQCYHHHLVFMLDKILTKQEKQIFNCLSTFESVDQYLLENVLHCYEDFGSVCEPRLGEFIDCQYPEEITLKHSSKCRGCSKSICYCTCDKYDSNKSCGSYFKSHVNYDDVDYMEASLFDDPL